MHAFHFRFKNGQENQSSFSIHDQNTAETSQPLGQPTDDWRAIDRTREVKNPAMWNSDIVHRLSGSPIRNHVQSIRNLSNIRATTVSILHKKNYPNERVAWIQCVYQGSNAGIYSVTTIYHCTKDIVQELRIPHEEQKRKGQRNLAYSMK